MKRIGTFHTFESDNRGKVETFFHQSPAHVDRPTGPYHYFGTKAFMDAFPKEFGGKITEYEVPKNVLEITRDTPAGRRLAARLALSVFPDDQNWADELLANDDNAWKDLYDIWTDSSNVAALIGPGVDAVKYGEEYVVPQHVIRKLRKV